MRLILAGAVSGVVIDITFMLYALHYNTARLVIFGLFALPCIVLAWEVFDWALIRAYPKLAAVGAVAAALLSVVPFIYTSVYLPSTADVAIQPTLTAGTPVSIRPGLSLLDLKFALQDKSAIRAVALTSMVTVSGITYRGKKADFGSSPSQKRAIAIGLDKPFFPNLEFNGRRHITLMTLKRAISDGSYIYPNSTLTTEIPVLMPVGKYQELDVRLTLLYARSDRLALAKKYFGPRIVQEDNCANDVRSAWFITQSLLSLLTRGKETAVTDWCATLGDPGVTSFFGGAPGKRTPDQVTQLEAAAYALRYIRESWVIRLPEN